MCDQQFLILIVSLLLLSSITSARKQCAEIDFDRFQVFKELRECKQGQLPPLAIKDYSTNSLPKYRPTSRYFLGTNFNEHSCIELSAKFSLTPDSYIEAPVYLKSEREAYVNITVYDMDRNAPLYAWRFDDGKGGAWSVARIDIKSEIPNAQIVIQTFMNAHSFVAIEYFHIRNEAIDNFECMDVNMPIANIKPFLKQGQIQPTQLPNQQGPQQGGPHWTPQQGPQQGEPGQPTRPPGQQGSQPGPQPGQPWQIQPTQLPNQQAPQDGGQHWNPQQGAPGQPTRPPGQQGPQQNPQSGQPGQIQPTKPSGLEHWIPNANNNTNNIHHESLVAILVLSTISITSIILIGLYYCFVGSRQKGTHHCNKRTNA